MSEDFYSVLGVDRDASEDEIKDAYRKQAAKHHPDVSDDPDAEEKFKRIRKAKEVLTDEEKRQAYDRLGHDRFVEAEKHGGFDQGGPGGAGGAAGPGRGPFGGAAGPGGDPFGGGLGDLFEQFFGGGGGRSRRGGADLRTEVTIDLEEAYRGTRKEMTITRPSTCPTCDGRGHPAGASSATCRECGGRGQVTRVQQTPFGRVQQRATCERCEGEGIVYEETCGECGGDGTVRREVTVEFEIPAGIQDGQTIRVEGEGAAGERGQPSGDLLVEISVGEHERFERDGNDLYASLALSFPQAVFGDVVEVETIDGTVELEVPPGTQPGKRFRIRGEGMPQLTDRGRRRGPGDLYVVAQVATPSPEELTDEQREALEAFAEAGGEEIEVDGEGFFERLRSSL